MSFHKSKFSLGTSLPFYVFSTPTVKHLRFVICGRRCYLLQLWKRNNEHFLRLLIRLFIKLTEWQKCYKTNGKKSYNPYRTGKGTNCEYGKKDERKDWGKRQKETRVKKYYTTEIRSKEWQKQLSSNVSGVARMPKVGQMQDRQT